MINYTWDCKTVDVYPQEGDLENVVYNVHWKLEGEHSELSFVKGKLIGTQVLDTSNIENFVPVDELTNDIITNWVKEAMGQEEVTKLEEIMVKQMTEQITPSSVTMTITK
jgi:hypothetical protein